MFLDSRKLQVEINEYLGRIGVVLPVGLNFEDAGGKEAFLAALQTKVASVRAAKAAEDERKRERERERRAEPLALDATARRDDEEIVDRATVGGDAEILDDADDEADEGDDVRSSALARFTRPKPRPVGSPLERYFHGPRKR